MNRDSLINVARFKKLLPYISTEVVQQLMDYGFFDAPASTKYHGNYVGGLFDHSLEVAMILQDLTVKNNLKWSSARSPILIGMFHDICKMDMYSHNGTGYEYNDDTLYKGHGDKSIIVLSSMLQLTQEEVACIRYHMGAFTDKSLWNDYTRAVRMFPNVLWTHQADMIATHIKGV